MTTLAELRTRLLATTDAATVHDAVLALVEHAERQEQRADNAWRLLTDAVRKCVDDTARITRLEREHDRLVTVVEVQKCKLEQVREEQTLHAAALDRCADRLDALEAWRKQIGEPTAADDRDALIAGLRKELAETARTRDEIVEAYAALRRERDELKAERNRNRTGSLLSDYACTACGKRMRSWAEFEEYQHNDCGGLVELAEITRARKVTIEQIAKNLERRAQRILERECFDTASQHRAAGLTDAVDALRAGTWREESNG